MAKSKKKHRQFVKEVEFKMRRGQSLVISLGINPSGLDIVIVENNKGVTEVTARGHSRFEFSDDKVHPNACDFSLSNPYRRILLEDHLISQFWGQFGWGELFKHHKNRSFKKAINEAIKQIVEEFESDAVEKLNGITEKLNSAQKQFKILKDGQIQGSFVPGKYVGYKPRKIFGRLDCRSGLRLMKPENRVFFLTWGDAIAEEYRPCKKCKPTPHDTYPNR